MDVSLFDIALANTAYPAVWYLNEGHVQTRLARSAHPSLTPCQLYTTQDGWIFIMCNKEKFWPELCRVMKHDEWASDARFKRFRDRLEHRALIEEMLDAELSCKTTAEWLALFAGQVPAAPIYDLRQALENPYVAERGLIQSISLAGFGEYRMVASPVRCSGAATPAHPAPKLGEHTEDILGGLGYDAGRLAALRKARVI
jgi:crotonobetainyl-CoA:carnitine CoA-transferase CaiB-like acyl-CoA transferase